VLVLVAPDKFKGSLGAGAVADAIAAGLAQEGLAARCMPLADGGDGSVEAAVRAGFELVPVTVGGADRRPLRAGFAFDGTTAVVEVAQTCGLATLRDRVLLPTTSSSHGFGEAVLAALERGATRLVLALGGSASTDGGAGMLAALGVRFRDHGGAELVPSGDTLGSIHDVDVSGLVDLAGIELIVATDVTNPLLGANGAAAVFGPQKGATPPQVRQLDAGLDHLVDVLSARASRTGAVRDPAGVPGAGSAGGIGFACLWLGARQVPGADFFLDLLGFDDAVVDCDAVITGEGRIDGQTLAGKLPCVVAARSGDRTVFAVVGRNDLTSEEERRLGLAGVHALTDMSVHDPSRDREQTRQLLSDAGRAVGHRIRALARHGV
jgi:glycerate kinase